MPGQNRVSFPAFTIFIELAMLSGVAVRAIAFGVSALDSSGSDVDFDSCDRICVVESQFR